MPYIFSSNSQFLDYMSQTMLLTKPLTTFLSQNTSPQLPTLLLVSPDGKLLSSSSPLPASLLRTQSTAACTLWNLYHPFEPTNNLISSALSHQNPSSPGALVDNDISSITIQLSHGIMVIRALSCGLIFVAIGPTITSNTRTASPLPHAHTLLTSNPRSTPVSPPASPPLPQDGHAHEDLGERTMSGGALNAIKSGTPSIAGSVGSSVTGARTQASILGVKRQADEVGRWLEEQLKGFVLSSGEGR